MKPSEYLDAVRVELGLPSDYALQKPLTLSKQQLSRYRNDLDFFSDEVACRVAEILGKRPGLVVLDMHRARSHSEKTRQAWEDIAEGFLTLSLRAKSGRRLALHR